MPRWTLRLTDEQDQWVEQQADDRDRSKSYIVANLIDQHRTDAVSDRTDDAPDRTGSVHERIAALEARVDALESALDESADTRASAQASADAAGGNDDSVVDAEEPLTAESDAVESDRIRAAVEDGSGGWTQRVDERREAGAVALRELRGGWTGTGGELVERVRKQGAGVESQNDQTMWRRTLRPVCQAAEERGLVTQESGTHVWRWVG